MESQNCYRCFQVLQEKGIIPKTAKSFILTNSEKNMIEQNLINWLLYNMNNPDLDIVQTCYMTIISENKCEKYQDDDYLETLVGMSSMRI